MNPLELDWAERLAWYDGFVIVAGLSALLVWMRLPSMEICGQCAARPSVERFAVWSEGPREVLDLCASCVVDLEDNGGCRLTSVDADIPPRGGWC